MNILNEPVVLTTAIRACILAGAAFGLHVTPEQLAALMLAVEAVLAVFARSASVSVRMVNQRMDEDRHPVTGEPNA